MDMIDRQAALESIDRAVTREVARWSIEDLPSIDLIRCKDCKFWQDNNGGYPNMNCRWLEDETPDAEDFCSYGERRMDEQSNQ